MSANPASVFAARMNLLARDLERLPATQVGEMARVTKEGALAHARSGTSYGTVQQGWVRYKAPKVEQGTASTILQVRGGFAYLTELGSYKAPIGWVIRPQQATTRSVRSRARKTVGRGAKITAADLDSARGSYKRALRPPYGPKARVWHKYLRARPWFFEGARDSRQFAAAMASRSFRKALSRRLSGG